MDKRKFWDFLEHPWEFVRGWCGERQSHVWASKLGTLLSVVIKEKEQTFGSILWRGFFPSWTAFSRKTVYKRIGGYDLSGAYILLPPSPCSMCVSKGWWIFNVFVSEVITFHHKSLHMEHLANFLLKGPLPYLRAKERRNWFSSGETFCRKLSWSTCLWYERKNAPNSLISLTL